MADIGNENAQKLKGTTRVNVRKYYSCKRDYLLASSPDDQYVLVGTESDWYWNIVTVTVIVIVIIAITIAITIAINITITIAKVITRAIAIAITTI